MDGHEVAWTEPGRDARDSLPIGNGEVGANVWVESDGAIGLLLARTDAWSENARLLKLGRLRVTVGGCGPDVAVRQRFRTDRGIVEIELDTEEVVTEFSVFVDAETDTVRIQGTSTTPTSISVTLDPWRTETRLLPRDPDESAEIRSATGLEYAPTPIVVSPDHQFALDDRLVWYHRNDASVWPRNLTLQGLDHRIGTDSDPLLGRTFGGVISGQDLVHRDDTTLDSEGPQEQHQIVIETHTAQPALVGEWLEVILDRTDQSNEVPSRVARNRTIDAWQQATDRSYIRASGTEGARIASRGYELQRYQLLAAGRGAFPIKFNGSLFTVDWQLEGETFDPDYRRWGGHYWFQNTRLAYWPLLQAGDFDCLDPLFRMYRNTLSLASDRTQRYYDHDGAFFPETMTFWGTYLDRNYGWNRSGRATGEIANDYIRYYWQGGLELLMLGLDRYAFAHEEAFLTETLLPLAKAILTFYDEHYPRIDGTIRFEPANALETWWDVVDPLPEIAGLDAVLDRLLSLPGVVTDAPIREEWASLRADLPPIPTREDDGDSVLAPAAEFGSDRENFENPELYSVFPYRRHGIGRPDLEVARRTFRRRDVTDNAGWSQDPIQAACLGLTNVARDMVVERFATHYDDARFPGFWGPNHDWIPDQDHGSVGMIALQRMLLQYTDSELFLFPAWPADWDVEFRLHAPKETVLEGEYRDGDLDSLSVSPSDRRADLEIVGPK